MEIDCFQYHCFDIPGVACYETPSLFIDSTGINPFLRGRGGLSAETDF